MFFFYIFLETLFLQTLIDISQYYVNNSLIQLSVTAKSLLNHLMFINFLSIRNEWWKTGAA
jgi:hypothetical protein